MYCKNCGAENDDNAYQCTECGTNLQNGSNQTTNTTNQTYVPNYLAFSIITTLLCCLPFGIAAIIYSSKVNEKLAAGDVDGAEEASKKAKAWCWWAVIGGVVGAILWVVFQVIIVAAAASQGIQ
jgi:hypothetical protein